MERMLTYQGSELNNVRGGKLEGIKVCSDRVRGGGGGTPFEFLQLCHYAVIGWATDIVNE